MFPPFRSLFDTDFTRVDCFGGAAEVLWLPVVSDLVIALSSLAILVVLVRLIFQRQDRAYRIVAGPFALFIAGCGLTHLVTAWTAWAPIWGLIYRLEAITKGATALLAVTAALALMRMRAYLSRIPSAVEIESEIQERKGALEKAHEKDERFRAFVESVQDYTICMLDPEGVVQTWNQGAQQMTGYTAGEIIGQCFSRFFTEEDRAAGKPQETLATVRETGRYEGEVWRVRKDGTRFLANLVLRPLRKPSGELSGFSKVTRDLTESRGMEARYRTLLEAAPDAIVISGPGGLIDLTNLEAERLFGYGGEEMVGQPVTMLIPEELRGGYRVDAEQFLQGDFHRRMGAGLELRARRKDGSEVPVEISFSPLEGPAGISMTAAIRDVTERVAAARLLSEKMTELRQSNEALEQFAHIASHDLQEPLRMVASYVQLLAKRYKGRLDGDADEFIGFAIDGTQRMKRLIEDLLVYSRAGRGAPSTERISSEEALQEALYNLRASIEESHAEVTYDALPTVATGELQLVQLFQNLVGNAIKYRGERTPQIHISARCQEAEDGEEWVFSVTDNGIGIEPQYFERVFVIFQRLHGRGEYEGTGIGLAICKRVLQQQGGRIWVESEPGQGSVFHFSLPVR